MLSAGNWRSRGHGFTNFSKCPAALRTIFGGGACLQHMPCWRIPQIQEKSPKLVWQSALIQLRTSVAPLRSNLAIAPAIYTSERQWTPFAPTFGNRTSSQRLHSKVCCEHSGCHERDRLTCSTTATLYICNCWRLQIQLFLTAHNGTMLAFTTSIF